jgi:hypothetical protein
VLYFLCQRDNKNVDKREGDRNSMEELDIKKVFPGATTSSEEEIQVQEFVIGNTRIKLVTFISSTRIPGHEFSRKEISSMGGNIPHAGIILEGEHETGRFQRRGAVGNSLKDRVINPINVNKAEGYQDIYDLILEGELVASFTYSDYGRMRKYQDNVQSPQS